MLISDLMRNGLSALKIAPDEEAIEKLLRYFLELKKWNLRMNLVGQDSDSAIIENHFLDSLTVLPFLDPCPPPGLIDVGSGAGFPGLPLKIVRRDILVKLVEPRRKRASFLRHIIRTLKLDGAEVLECRLEEKRPELSPLRHSAPLIISRAVTGIAPFLEMSRPYCNKGSRVICMKGPKAESELAEWQNTAEEKSGFTLSSRHTPVLPFSDISRNLLIFNYRGV